MSEILDYEKYLSGLDLTKDERIELIEIIKGFAQQILDQYFEEVIKHEIH